MNYYIHFTLLMLSSFLIAQVKSQIVSCSSLEIFHELYNISNLDNQIYSVISSKRWTGGVIPYNFHSSLIVSEQQVIQEAFQEFHAKTCIRFVKRNSNVTNYLNLEIDNEVCGKAQVCMQGGYQYAKFGKTCLTKASVIHQLGHTLCLLHEHQRWDRDDWLSFENKNCTQIPEKLPKIHYNGVYYDYRSQMHNQCGSCSGGWPKNKFTKGCGSDVTSGLSVFDVDKINKLYGCQNCLRHRWIHEKSLKFEDNFALHTFGYHDLTNNPLFPCRGFYKGNLLVGKTNFMLGGNRWAYCWLPYESIQHTFKKDFEILTIPGNLKDNQSEYKLVEVNETWSKKRLDRIFVHAVIGGYIESEDGSNYTDYIYVGYIPDLNVSHYCPARPYFQQSGGRADAIGSIRKLKDRYEFRFPLCRASRAYELKYYVLTCQNIRNNFSTEDKNQTSDLDEATLSQQSLLDTDSIALIVIVGGLSLLLIIVLMCGVLVYNRRVVKAHQHILRYLSETEIQDFVKGIPNELQSTEDDYFNKQSYLEALPYDEHYEISPENIKIDHSCMLGSGEYGEVYKGKIQPSTNLAYLQLSNLADSTYLEMPQDVEVAIKVCKGHLDIPNFKALLTEIKVMAYLGAHTNIVCLIGASTQNIRSRELYIAVEYCHNSSMDKFLQANKHKFLQPDLYYEQSTNCYLLESLTKWSRQIADGLEFIHSKKIIHADLAIRNIMLTKNLTAKIGDFGLSRLLVNTYLYKKKTDSALPWRSMAVECLKCMEFSAKSDIWAFGVTLWEIFSLGDTPYQGTSYSARFVDKLVQGYRLSKPSLASEQMYQYMKLCWKSDPKLRPEPNQVKLL